MILTISILCGLVCALIGAVVADEKNRGRAGFWLGLFFGPLGIIMALLLPAAPTPKSAIPLKIPKTGMSEEDADFQALIKSRGKVGIGIKERTIISVAADSAASVAGVKTGDRLIAIDDQLCEGDTKAIILRLTGDRGSIVRISVRRKNDALEFKLIRK